MNRQINRSKDYYTCMQEPTVRGKDVYTSLMGWGWEKVLRPQWEIIVGSQRTYLHDSLAGPDAESGSSLSDLTNRYLALSSVCGVGLPRWHWWLGLISRWRRSPGGGHSNPFQCSYLENLTDRGAWQVIVHRVAQSWTLLRWLSSRACGVNIQKVFGGKWKHVETTSFALNWKSLKQHDPLLCTLDSPDNLPWWVGGMSGVDEGAHAGGPVVWSQNCWQPMMGLTSFGTSACLTHFLTQTSVKKGIPYSLLLPNRLLCLLDCSKM